jgi:hypothetical protein
MDWVQVLTIVIAGFCLFTLTRLPKETSSKDYFFHALFITIIFIPFARVLGII